MPEKIDLKIKTEIAVQVSKSMRQTVNEHKRVLRRMTIRNTVIMAISVVLIVGSFFAGIKYANTDLRIQAKYNQVVSENIEKAAKVSKLGEMIRDYESLKSSHVNFSFDTITNIYKDVVGSIVGINVDVVSKTPWGEGTGKVRGSGAIIGKIGDSYQVVTNQHVIENGKTISLVFNNGVEVPASVVGVDSDRDIALLSMKIKDAEAKGIKNLKLLKLADSSKVQVGEVVIAMGNPLGYNSTVTMGVVSGLNRVVDEYSAVRYIQTDAAINPGNSGGALLNMNGEIIGINTAKIKDIDVEGIGFSIPSTVVRKIIDQLASVGYVQKGYIGIYGGSGGEFGKGVYISNVIVGSPADTSGIKVGDFIISVDEKEINSIRDLSMFLSGKSPGETVELKIIRDSEQIVIKVVLGEAQQTN